MAQTVKASVYNVRDLGLIPGSGRYPGEGNSNPLQYSCLEIPWTEQVVGYSPWGRKELDTTARLHFLSLHEILTFSQYEPKKKEPQLRKTGSPFPANPHSRCLDPELTISGGFRHVKEQLLLVLEPQIWLDKSGS